MNFPLSPEHHLTPALSPLRGGEGDGGGDFKDSVKMHPFLPVPVFSACKTA